MLQRHDPAVRAHVRRRSHIGIVAAMAVAVLLAGGCGSSSSSSERSTTSTSAEGGGKGAQGEKFPDVLEVKVKKAGAGSFDVAVTISSPYESAARYADAWRVLDPEGNVLGVRELGHDHADEQPFTRNETVKIPDGVDKITVQGRDQVSGYGGKKVTVDVPR